MTPITDTQLELLREALIICAAASAPHAINLAIARQYARMMGHPVEDDRLVLELEYLMGAGIIEEADKLISPVNRAWKITKFGRDYAEKKKLCRA